MTKRLLLVMIVLGSAGALTAQTSTLKAKPPFQPAAVRLVADIPNWNTCIGAGTVVMDALITETGEVKDAEVRRDVACFTPFAVGNLKTWKFSPATLAGKAVASRVPVAFTFEPQFPSGDPVIPSPLIPQSAVAIQAEFQPAEVTRMLLPHPHPGFTFAMGTVVLEVTLNEKGEADEINVLRDVPPFTEGARAAVGDWRFMPATFKGRPVQSKIVLAFVSPPYFPAKPTPE